MQHIYDVAESHVGVKEFPAAKHNPTIVKYYKDSGHAWVQDDETPWCAAFVGSVLAECGLSGSIQIMTRTPYGYSAVTKETRLTSRRIHEVAYWEYGP